VLGLTGICLVQTVIGGESHVVTARGGSGMVPGMFGSSVRCATGLWLTGGAVVQPGGLGSPALDTSVEIQLLGPDTQSQVGSYEH
jgi:hypothetical protein